MWSIRHRWWSVLRRLASVDPAIIGSGCSNFLSCKNYSTSGDCPTPYCQWNGDECVPELSDVSAKQCFYTYREKYLTRNKVIYVGANDGMVSMPFWWKIRCMVN